MSKAAESSFLLNKPQNSSQGPLCDLEEILEASHDDLFITDGNGKVIMANSENEKIWNAAL